MRTSDRFVLAGPSALAASCGEDNRNVVLLAGAEETAGGVGKVSLRVIHEARVWSR